MVEDVLDGRGRGEPKWLGDVSSRSENIYGMRGEMVCDVLYADM